MRVVIADDVMIVRSGLSRLLSDAGVAVVGEAGDGDELLRLVAIERPDAAIVDIRMPPTHRDEGLVTARLIRERYPNTAVLLLSEYLAPRYAERLLADQPAGLGYLLKERVSDVGVLLDALERTTSAECVVDPAIVERLLKVRERSPLRALTERERQTLALMAEGRSNAAIADRLGIGERTVESLCAQLFRKLDLEPDPDVNRRVLAVLAFLRPGHPRASTVPRSADGA
jgi:DNA-binding NarL/FixJ family response regulator